MKTWNASRTRRKRVLVEVKGWYSRAGEGYRRLKMVIERTGYDMQLLNIMDLGGNGEKYHRNLAAIVCICLLPHIWLR